MHPATRRKLEEFARAVNWIMPHPLHRRKFNKFVIEACRNGDTRLSYDEFRGVIMETVGRSPVGIDDWMREYERGVALLLVSREES